VLNGAGLPAGWETTKVENNQYQDSRLITPDAPPGNASTITNLAVVNGQINPALHLQNGVWTRWRLLNAAAFFIMDLR
jgi:FtsP/CotA-like multicopper oxidase with cupredoxin domain